ncbi:hypothetical protein M514_23348 [Trichuris suis]|uniref:Uncharacterized protein n=1 Tax=Trichuris suis TaxID=68888 RepID=A0A085N4V5_9BILA|nr:hypothetical protein M514_23348 [Trichuris suis]
MVSPESFDSLCLPFHGFISSHVPSARVCHQFSVQQLERVTIPWIQYRSSSLSDGIAAIVKNGFGVLVTCELIYVFFEPMFQRIACFPNIDS